MVPTAERNHQSIFIEENGQGFLFDCGEGTQRQMKIIGIKPTKINNIFISHWHGDHVLGLPGLLQTLSASEYESKLRIYGPKDTIKRFEDMFSAFNFTLSFEYEIKEIKNEIINFRDVIIESRELDHGVPCIGFSIKEKDKIKIKTDVIKKLKIPEGPLLGKLQEGENIVFNGKKISPKDTTYSVPGKKVSIILDTLPCKNADALASGSDILISEAVYLTDLDNKAIENKHMTAKQAAELASRCDVKKLVLTHFSQRYKTTEEILEEARNIFDNTIAAYDLLKIKA